MKILHYVLVALFAVNLAACNREEKSDPIDNRPETAAKLVLDELQAPIASVGDERTGNGDRRFGRQRDAEWE